MTLVIHAPLMMVSGLRGLESKERWTPLPSYKATIFRQTRENGNCIPFFIGCSNCSLTENSLMSGPP